MRRRATGRGLAVLWARRGLGFCVAAVIVVAGVSAAAMVPERWTARTRLLVQVGSAVQGRGAQAVAAVMATHAELIGSQRVALGAVEGLWRTTAMAPETEWTVLQPEARAREIEAARVLERLHVETRPGSAMVSIVWSGDEPIGAARMANALARSYLDVLEDWPREDERRAWGSALDSSMNAVVLDPAQPPLRADPSLRGWLVVASLGLAVLGAWLAVLWAEWRRPMVRTWADLQRLMGLNCRVMALRRIVPPGVMQRLLSWRRSRGAPIRAGTLPVSAAGAAEVLRADDAVRASPISGVPRALGSDGQTLEHHAVALAAPRASAPSGRPAGAGRLIGELLIEAGLMHPPEVARTLVWARQHGLRFGEAALARRVLSEAHLQRILAVQFGVVELETGGSVVSREVFLAYDRSQPAAADIRCLRARLERLPRVAPHGLCVALVGPGRGVGRSVLAANLAVCEAQAGRRVVLVDADLRSGRLRRVFGLTERGGLSSMLNQRIDGAPLQRVPGLGGLTVLGAGPRPPNPAELLSRTGLSALLNSFQRGFDRVIVDTGPLDRDVDAALVVRCVGVAILVARRDHTELAALREAHRDLRAEGVHVAAVVLNAPPQAAW